MASVLELPRVDIGARDEAELSVSFAGVMRCQNSLA